MKRCAANLLCMLAFLALAHVPSLRARAVGTTTGLTNTATPERQIQFGVRFMF
jgi:hypothetical protein